MSPGIRPCTTDSACSMRKINPLAIPQISKSEIEDAIRLMPICTKLLVPIVSVQRFLKSLPVQFLLHWLE